jgi:hypothetical protein
MPRPVSASLVVVLLTTVLVVGCTGSSAAPFDPASPCVADGSVPGTDGSAPGAYPDLEALIPTTYEGQPPETLDSGRHCTTEHLGALAELGFDEVRFAGGTWSFGGRRSAALAVFSAPDLSAEDVAVFYTNSAAATGRTVVTGTSTPELAGRPGFRIDTETGERIQSVLVWPSAVDGRVNVVLSTDLPDARLMSAVDTLEAAAGP